MKFLSVCSGIEAASVAWRPLGWQAVAFAEIEKFPAAVLRHHYPDVENRGDMTRFHEWPDAAIDVLVGGTPCQSFSVAGLRKGLDDPRGSLLLVYLAIARRYRPAWLVWENVPGVLSIDDGRAFGSLLGGLALLGYGFAYRVLDAQYFRLAQRRRRVFVVGHLGDWRRAAAVLFERASLSGHPSPRREAGQDVAAGTLRSTDGGVDCDHGAAGHIVPALTACGGTERKHGHGWGQQELANGYAIPIPFDTTQVTHRENRSNPGPGAPCHPLASEAHAPAIAFEPRVASGRRSGVIGETVGALTKESDRGDGFPCVAFSVKDHGADAGELAPTLRAGGHDRSHANGGVMPAVAYAIGSHAGAADADVSNRSHASGGPVGLNISEELAYTVREGRGQSVAFADLADPVAANQGRTYTREGTHNFRVSNVAISRMQVRRLTPRECERLQGFPDDYTLIPYNGKPAKDGPRYKALGNSMAVPCMSWIGRRIQMVNEI